LFLLNVMSAAGAIFPAPFTVGGNTSSRNAIASDCLPYYYMGANIHCKAHGTGGEPSGLIAWRRPCRSKPVSPGREVL